VRYLVARLLAAVVLSLLVVPAAAAWTWPVEGPILERFSFDADHPYAAGQHRGVAIGAAAGAPVRAPAAGVVSFAGSVPASGKTVTIETRDGLSVTLTHLGTLASGRGDAVAEGVAVGTVGSSGTAEFDVPYVHLGIRKADDDQGYLDPLSFLPVLGPPAVPKPSSPPAPVPAPVAAAPAPAPAPAPMPITRGATPATAPATKRARGVSL